MEFIYILFVFLIGITVGSFLGVIVDRTNRGEKFVLSRSHCDFCKKELEALDLVPVLSFIFLGGKCRYCKQRLSMFYPTIEVFTGILFILAVLSFFPQALFLELNFPNLALLFLLFYILSVLTVIFFVDLKFGIIPFGAVFTGFIAALILHIYFPMADYSFGNYLLSGLGAFAFFLIIFLATRGRGMGFGDVVYVFLMGFLLGFPEIIIGLYIAFLSGAVVALTLVVMKFKKLRGDSIPFGPFLIAGTLVSLFWGDVIIDFVTSLLVA